MIQNTLDWLEWRRKGLGASDATIVMGVSPYKTRRQLWENKLKLRPDDEESYITELGHQFEPRARAQFALETGIDLESDVCLEHPEFPFLRASLDGHCAINRIFAEIKMVGQKKFDWIKENKKPLDEHYPQTSQQFLVTGYERGFYIAYTLNEIKADIKDFIAVPIAPNHEYNELLFRQLQAFWKLVETQEPPELEARDIYEFKDKEVLQFAEQYANCKLALEVIQKKHDEMAEKLKAIASVHAKVKIGNLSIDKIARKGNVDYSKIPALKGLDLEPYRKPASSYQRITVE